MAYTGVGFQPKAIHFIMNAAATNMSTQSSWGFDNGTVHYASLIRAAANGVTSSYSIFSGDGATWDCEALVKTFDSDGFTLTWSKTGSPPAGTMTIFYLAFR